MKDKTFAKRGTTTWAAILCLGGWLSTAYPAEFIYLDLMGNTIPSSKCHLEDVARSRASSTLEIDRYAKVFCETQGYGWHVDQRKNDGITVCEECKDSPGKQQCHVEDIQVTCKRLKPGSAGLIPGKG